MSVLEMLDGRGCLQTCVWHGGCAEVTDREHNKSQKKHSELALFSLPLKFLFLNKDGRSNFSQYLLLS